MPVISGCKLYRLYAKGVSRIWARGVHAVWGKFCEATPNFHDCAHFIG